MSLWDLAVCIDGHNRINGAQPKGAGGGMSEDTFRKLTAGMN